MKVEKKKEILSYLFFGVTTTIVNIAVFQIFMRIGIDYKIANLLALILAKLYAYVTNKWFVFRSHCNSLGELMMEFLRFASARGVTGLIDYFGLIFAIEVLNFAPVLSKYILQVIVIVLNYILSKMTVFKKCENEA